LTRILDREIEVKQMRTASVIVFFAALILTLSAIGCAENDDSTEAPDVQVEDVPAATEDAVDAAVEEDIVLEKEVAVEEDLAPEDLGPPDEEAPTVSLDIEPLTALQNNAELPVEWSDNVGIAKAELLIDGEVACEIDVATKVADTSGQEPGQHELAVKVYDAAGNTAETESVAVMLAGPGEFLPFSDSFTIPIIPGWGGKQLKVFDFATEVKDEKGHVAMPSDMTKTVLYFKWEGSDPDSAWELGLDLGTGTCPHSGVLLAFSDHEGEEGFVELEYEDAGNALPTGKWFAHLRFTDGLDHKGETVTMILLWLALP